LVQVSCIGHSADCPNQWSDQTLVGAGRIAASASLSSGSPNAAVGSIVELLSVELSLLAALGALHPQRRASVRTGMPDRSDRELADAARDGDTDAFGVLVRRHQKRIYRLAVHLLRNAAEAEDVTQETFVRAYRALDRFGGRSEPYTWMYRIAVNLSLNAIRSRKQTQRRTTPDDPRVEALLVERRAAHADPGAVAADRQLATVLCEGIDQLSDTLRTTLILVSVDGLSHAEACAALGCPEGTVAWRVHEARRKLRAYLAERGYGGEAGDVA
jgi:RNA polymerase sigma-70 factor (ECF subfamily)